MKFREYEKGININFEHDGCTFAPDGSWGSCCRIHDHAKSNRLINDKDADKMLLECTKDRSNFVLAYIYYFAVRFRSITGMTPISIIWFLSFISALTWFTLNYG